MKSVKRVIDVRGMSVEQGGMLVHYEINGE